MSEPVGTLSDAALVRAAQAGDTAGLGALLERHRSRLHAIAVSVVGHGPAAEDAVQDTFLIALRRIGELRDPAAARAWLATILVNVCRGQLRRPAARVGPGFELWDPPGPDTAAQAIDDGALRDWVWTALERLSEPLRLAVMLRYFTGASSYEAIADVCGVPVGTVRSRLSAAKAKLAEELLEHRGRRARRGGRPLAERSAARGGLPAVAARRRRERVRRRADPRRRVRHVRPHRAPRRDALRRGARERLRGRRPLARRPGHPRQRGHDRRGRGSTARPTSRCTAHPPSPRSTSTTTARRRGSSRTTRRGLSLRIRTRWRAPTGRRPARRGGAAGRRPWRASSREKRMSSTSRHGPGGAAGDRERAAHVGDLLDGVGHLALGRAVATRSSDAAWNGQRRARRASRRAKSGTSSPLRRDGLRAPPRRTGAPPCAHRLRRRGHQLVVEAPRAPARLHQRVPAAVAQPRQRAALLGAHLLGELAHLARRRRAPSS